MQQAIAHEASTLKTNNKTACRSTAQSELEDDLESRRGHLSWRGSMSHFVESRMFREGDRVRVVGPLADIYRGDIGVVRSVNFSGSVHRYGVEFTSGRTESFFGFELVSYEPPAKAQSA